MIDHEAVENSPELKAYYSDKRLFYKNVFWYLFGNCAALFGQNTAQTLMPLHMEGVGLNAQQISTILAMGGWLGMPLMLYFSHLTDHWQWKYGRRLPFLAMCLPFMITAMIVMPYASTMISCMAVYALYISFNQIKYTTYPYLLNDISKKCYWGRVSGLSMVIGCAGTWFGQFFLMPMVDTHGESFVFRTGAIFVAVATTLTLIFVKEPPIRNSEPPRFNPVPVVWSTLKVGFASPIRLATCLAFALVCGVGMAAYYVPLQGKANLGLTEGQIGKSILQFGTMAQVTLYFVGGWIVDKAGSAKCMIVGILLLVLACFLGFDPKWVSHTASSLLDIQIRPALILTAAYILSMMATAFVYPAATVFIMSSVARTEVAKFCSCAGACNIFVQSSLMFTSGWLITHIFNGNYGFAFIMAVIFVSIGVPFFYFIPKWSKRMENKLENSKNELPVQDQAVVEGNDICK